MSSEPRAVPSAAPPAVPSGVLPRMYTDLAPWWPLLSPPEDYADEAAMLAGLLHAGMAQAEITSASRRPVLLELGSGGGHNAVHLAEHFDLVLVDASVQMLEVSRALNPGAEHHVGDMRAVRLGRTVDAVLIHDAIDYLVTEADLDAAFATARAHLDVGGVAVFVPDHVAEDFEPSSDHGGTDAPDGRGIRYLEWTWDPDPADTWARTEFAYLIREADGTVTSFAESHTFGLFPVATWLEALQRHGFAVTTVTEQAEDDEWARTIFVTEAD